MNKLISVIVPIYKVEKYLNQCIDSILKQSYSNLEIILVDDGSPDKCGKICDEYAKRDNRIKVIHKENRGLSDARNCGLRVANGEYIIFVDSDDYIDVNMCKVLLNNIINDNTDIVICNFCYFNDTNKTKNIFNKCLNNGVFYSIDVIKKYFLYTPIELIVSWNKIYKRELFIEGESFFPINRLHEDWATSYRLYFKADKISIVNDILYYYRKRNGSIANNISEKNIRDLMKNVKEIYYFGKVHNINEVIEHSINTYYYLIDLVLDDKKLSGALQYLKEFNFFIRKNIEIRDVVKRVDIKLILKYLLIKFNKVALIKKYKNKFAMKG